MNLGAALLQSGNLSEAEKALLRNYELKGANAAGAQLLLGQLHLQRSDYQKAIEAFETYLRDAPNAPNAAKVRQSIEQLRQSGSRTGWSSIVEQAASLFHPGTNLPGRKKRLLSF